MNGILCAAVTTAELDLAIRVLDGLTSTQTEEQLRVTPIGSRVVLMSYPIRTVNDLGFKRIERTSNLMTARDLVQCDRTPEVWEVRGILTAAREYAAML